MSDDESARTHRNDVQAKAKAMALELLLDKGLYNTVTVDDEVSQKAEEILRGVFIGAFDCFCIQCKKETPFIASRLPATIVSKSIKTRPSHSFASQPENLFMLNCVCQRDSTNYIYIFQKHKNRLMKIGQYPSMADISFSDLQGIDKALDPIDRKELGTAIGLSAHDAASGAFV